MRVALPLISPPPKLSGHRMRWFHSGPSGRRLQRTAAAFGSVAVLGLESMLELEALRDAYGFEHVQAIPELHAAEVSVDPAQLHALLANAGERPADPLRRASRSVPAGSWARRTTRCFTR